MKSMNEASRLDALNLSRSSANTRTNSQMSSLKKFMPPHESFFKISSVLWTIPRNQKRTRFLYEGSPHFPPASSPQYQHREFVFIIFIPKRVARFIRADRVGFVRSKEFDYVKQPQILFDFVHRIGQMSNEQLGYDPTVVLAGTDDQDCMKRFQPGHESHRKLLDDAQQTGWPIYSLWIPDKNVPLGKRKFLIGKPTSVSYSATGRGTKGYVAYEVGQSRLVFLKDSWRWESSRPEHEVYMQLKVSEVRNVAILVCGADVQGSGGQVRATRTQEFFAKGELDKLKRVHYRLVVEEIGTPLPEAYRESLDLCAFVFHALRGFIIFQLLQSTSDNLLAAHKDAWEKAGILHRDISVNNILVNEAAKDETGRYGSRAFLNDWDPFKSKEELGKGASAPSRSVWSTC